MSSRAPPATVLPDPLRIVHVTTSTDVGGAERMLRRTLRALAAHGAPRVESMVVSVKPLGDVGRDLPPGVRVVSLGLPRPASPVDLLREAVAIARLRAIVRAERPHVVQSWLPRADLLARFAAWRLAPVLASVRVVPLERTAMLRLDGWTRRLVVRWLAVSRGAADAHARLAGIERERIDVVPNALEVDELRSCRPAERDRADLPVPPGAFVIASLARLHAQKGLGDAVQAIALLGDPAHLVIAGEGPEREAMLRLAAVRGVAGRVHLTGVGDPRALLCRADAFVLPSLFEGMPGALLEAMALGLPCVATGIPGTDEVATDGEDALLVPPRDPASLAAALRRVMDDEALRRRLGEAARRRVLAERSMATHVERLLDVYARVLGAAREGAPAR